MFAMSTEHDVRLRSSVQRSQLSVSFGLRTCSHAVQCAMRTYVREFDSCGAGLECSAGWHDGLKYGDVCAGDVGWELVVMSVRYT